MYTKRIFYMRVKYLLSLAFSFLAYFSLLCLSLQISADDENHGIVLLDLKMTFLLCVELGLEVYDTI